MHALGCVFVLLFVCLEISRTTQVDLGSLEEPLATSMQFNIHVPTMYLKFKGLLADNQSNSCFRSDKYDETIGNFWLTDYWLYQLIDYLCVMLKILLFRNYLHDDTTTKCRHKKSVRFKQCPDLPQRCSGCSGKCRCKIFDTTTRCHFITC